MGYQTQKNIASDDCNYLAPLGKQTIRVNNIRSKTLLHNKLTQIWWNEVEGEDDMRWREKKRKREVQVKNSTQPKSSSEFVLAKRILQRYLVTSDLKRDGLSISLSSRERLFQSR